jgi:2-polyprenyl-6-methoxyphenol hydroxylase-like FAD-dependent oxidoreductase
MRIAIAGFGVGGGALAVALARVGHDVIVYDEQPIRGLLAPASCSSRRARRSWPS